MEMEFFVHPSQEDEWFAYWVEERLRWWTDAIGIGADRLRLRPHDADELSHYSRQTTDIEYDFPMGWSELEGIADRRNFELTAHADASGKGMRSSTRPAVSSRAPRHRAGHGVDRAVLTVLVDGYQRRSGRG